MYNLYDRRVHENLISSQIVVFQLCHNYPIAVQQNKLENLLLQSSDFKISQVKVNKK